MTKRPRPTTRNAHLFIADRVTFRTSGALHGTEFPYGAFPFRPYFRWAELNAEDRAALDAYLKAPGNKYVVTSYDVPIAWYDGVSGWYVNEERYSRTTSRHQTQVRHAVDA